jgi:hypothetical protein
MDEEEVEGNSGDSLTPSSMPAARPVSNAHVLATLRIV